VFLSIINKSKIICYRVVTGRTSEAKSREQFIMPMVKLSINYLVDGVKESILEMLSLRNVFGDLVSDDIIF
jgi:hypothetical protein